MRRAGELFKQMIKMIFINKLCSVLAYHKPKVRNEVSHVHVVKSIKNRIETSTNDRVNSLSSHPGKVKLFKSHYKNGI